MLHHLLRSDGVRFFASPQDQLDADLVTFLEELERLLFAGFQIVRSDFECQADALDVNFPLLGFLLAFLLVLLVHVSTEVHDAADRWNCERRDLNEVQSSLPGLGEGIADANHPELVTPLVDYPNFWYPNLEVNP